MLSHAAWQGLFAGDPAIVGREIRINGLPRTVIGVLPRDFVGPNGQADFYFAFDLIPALASGAGWLGAGRPPEAGRDPGGRAARDRRHLGRPGARVRRTAGRGVSAMPLRDAMVGSTRTPLLVLLASAALVLLIACANLAGGPALPRSLAAQGVRRPRGARRRAPAPRAAAAHREHGARPGRRRGGVAARPVDAVAPARHRETGAAGLRRVVARSGVRCSSRP